MYDDYNLVHYPSRYRLRLKNGQLNVITVEPNIELGIAMSFFHGQVDKFSEEIQVLCDFLLQNSGVYLSDARSALRFSDVWCQHAKDEVELMARQDAERGEDYEMSFREALITFVRHFPPEMRTSF